MVGEDFETRVVGAVGLFPTVVDIARSESGMKASVSTSFCSFVGHFGRFWDASCDGLEMTEQTQLPQLIRPMRKEVFSNERYRNFKKLGMRLAIC